MRQIAREWQPWRTVATWYLWRSLDPIRSKFSSEVRVSLIGLSYPIFRLPAAASRIFAAIVG